MQPKNKKIHKILTSMQQGELTEYYIYKNIAKRVKNPANRKILIDIAEEELYHSRVWEKYTGKDLKPRKIQIFFYTIIAAIFGYTFAVKIMERGENDAYATYLELIDHVPEAEQIAKEEREHEENLVQMLDEERLRYIGSMVLGLNDALVELSGTLAGLTFALQNTRLIALSGLITGIAATLSMASSEYLSAKSDGKANPFKSCIYTGIMYSITVVILVLPYLLFSKENYLWALGCMLLSVILIILIFSYYVSVAKDLPFGSRFREMALISIGVAAISFLIGLLVKQLLGVDI